MKICSKCKIEKDAGEFSSDKNRPDGLYSQCKLCKKNAKKNYNIDQQKIKNGKKKYYQSHKSQIAIRSKQYRIDNIEKKLSYEHQYYEKNRDLLLLKHRNYYRQNKEQIAKSRKQYSQANRERLLAARRVSYYKNYPKHRDKHNEDSRKYYQLNKLKINERNQNRKKIDPIHHLRISVSSLVRQAFSNAGFKKNSLTRSIIGCSYEFLYQYLVQTAIQNYGFYDPENIQYELDHIIPLASDKTELGIICLNHYTNLQILTQKDNRDKWDKLDWVLPKYRKGDIV